MVQEIRDIYRNAEVIGNTAAHIQSDFFKAVLRDDMPAAEQVLVRALKTFDAKFGIEKQVAANGRGENLEDRGIKGPAPLAFPVALEKSKAQVAMIVANIFNISIAINNDKDGMPEVKASSDSIINQLMKSGNGESTDLARRAALAFNRMEMNF